MLAGERELLEVLLVQDHVTVLRVLVATDDLVVWDFLVLDRAPAQLANARIVVAVQLANEMPLLSVAVKSFTGMLTIPKLIAPRQIDRGGIGRPPPHAAQCWANQYKQLRHIEPVAR